MTLEFPFTGIIDNFAWLVDIVFSSTVLNILMIAALALLVLGLLVKNTKAE